MQVSVQRETGLKERVMEKRGWREIGARAKSARIRRTGERPRCSYRRLWPGLYQTVPQLLRPPAAIMDPLLISAASGMKARMESLDIMTPRRPEGHRRIAARRDSVGEVPNCKRRRRRIRLHVAVILLKRLDRRHIPEVHVGGIPDGRDASR